MNELSSGIFINIIIVVVSILFIYFFSYPNGYSRLLLSPTILFIDGHIQGMILRSPHQIVQ